LELGSRPLYKFWGNAIEYLSPLLYIHTHLKIWDQVIGVLPVEEL